MNATVSLRSLLFAPANHPRRMEKALELPTDAVIMDLEDAVADDLKTAARASAREHLGRPRGNRLVFVRINGLRTPWSFGDLDAVVHAGLDGIILPKSESANDIAIADYVITEFERARGLTAGSVDLMPLVETAKGALAMEAIATASTRVKRLIFGGGDFANDTRSPWILENPLTLFARAQLAIVSRAAGLEPPIDTAWGKIHDLEGLTAEARSARYMGYQGKMIIHPSHIDVANAMFSPSTEEIAAARKLSEAFAAAEAAGSAAIVVDGVFVDYPIAFNARNVLETARRLGLEGAG
ncbi:MAG: CoA ester lyase [Candidatus Velthaea sp.]